MTTSADDRTQAVKDCFEAFLVGDPAGTERHLAPSFAFSAPNDVDVDRTTFLSRWTSQPPSIDRFDFVRLRDLDGEVLVTYEAVRGAERFRNTELFVFDGPLIERQEVYHGWTVPR